MTNDDLEKKIAEIIDSSVDDWATRDRRGRIQVHVSTIADILVKAGLKFDTVVSHTATFDMLQQDRINELEKRLATMEHRSEIVEIALQRACADVHDMINLLLSLQITGLVTVENYSMENIEPSSYISRAEKELEEEQ